MKEWEQNIVRGSVVFLIGVILFLLSLSGYVPRDSIAVIILLLAGPFTTGLGAGVLMTTFTIRKLERKIGSLPLERTQKCQT